MNANCINLKSCWINVLFRFRCHKCGKACVSNTHLVTHLRDHLSYEETFECDICKMKIVRKLNLYTHMLRKHVTKQANYECEICKKRWELFISIAWCFESVFQLQHLPSIIKRFIPFFQFHFEESIVHSCENDAWTTLWASVSHLRQSMQQQAGPA